MGSAVIHDDLELYLTVRLRADLAARPEAYCHNIAVSNKWPDPVDSRPARLLVIRDDSGPSTSFMTADRSVGFTLLMPVEKDANDAARMVLALAAQVPGIEPGNPVTVVQSTTGPYSVTEQAPGFRRYLTVTYGVAGHAL